MTSTDNFCFPTDHNYIIILYSESFVFFDTTAGSRDNDSPLLLESTCLATLAGKSASVKTLHTLHTTLDTPHAQNVSSGRVDDYLRMINEGTLCLSRRVRARRHRHSLIFICCERRLQVEMAPMPTHEHTVRPSFYLLQPQCRWMCRGAHRKPGLQSKHKSGQTTRFACAFKRIRDASDMLFNVDCHRYNEVIYV